MRLLKIGRLWASRTKGDVMTLWFAMRHPGTPWYAKALAILAVAYALSPIDLIPDFIPVLGYLDDVILLPILIWLAVRALPAPVRADSRQRALARSTQARPRSRAAAVIIVLIWMAIALVLGLWLHELWLSPAAPADAA
ncbi:YkvA family protein [Bordetella flabilis]|uniref:YkvA family protein n=1 Tax=Bordetella flabilis TaxID=463014 RepID=UPI000A81D927|nr:YkvA family protein [Bordetella flabilis]